MDLPKQLPKQSWEVSTPRTGTGRPSHTGYTCTAPCRYHCRGSNGVDLTCAIGLMIVTSTVMVSNM